MQPCSPVTFGCAVTSALVGKRTYEMPSRPVSLTGGFCARDLSPARIALRPPSTATGTAVGSLSTTAQMACTFGKEPARFLYSLSRAFFRKTSSLESHGANEGVTRKTTRFCVARRFLSMCWSFSMKCSGFYKSEYRPNRGCIQTHSSSDRSRNENGAGHRDDVTLFVSWSQEIASFLFLSLERFLVFAVFSEVQSLMYGIRLFERFIHVRARSYSDGRPLQLAQHANGTMRRAQESALSCDQERHRSELN